MISGNEMEGDDTPMKVSGDTYAPWLKQAHISISTGDTDNVESLPAFLMAIDNLLLKAHLQRGATAWLGLVRPTFVHLCGRGVKASVYIPSGELVKLAAGRAGTDSDGIIDSAQLYVDPERHDITTCEIHSAALEVWATIRDSCPYDAAQPAHAYDGSPMPILTVLYDLFRTFVDRATLLAVAEEREKRGETLLSREDLASKLAIARPPLHPHVVTPLHALCSVLEHMGYLAGVRIVQTEKA